MSNLLKDIYSPLFYEKFSGVLKSTIPSFDDVKFKKLIFNDEFQTYELKERMTHTAKVLHCFLPTEFDKASKTLFNIIEKLRISNAKEDGFEYMFLPEYISMYGLNDYESSISALEFITQFVSCEFAVRPYILKYEKKMLQQMLSWSRHESSKVRRLASEGSRPRLPWAIALPGLKKSPEPLLAILHNLKQDSSETVRRSVANNLNDISKDNPEFVIDVVQSWKAVTKETDALLKHACRTLLKKGDKKALEIFGFDSHSIQLIDFKIITPKVNMGGELQFSFSISNTNSKKQMARLEYGLYYKKQNGKLSKKVFKISEREIEGNKSFQILKKQSFKLITTRKYYSGLHQLSIIINGQESEVKEFEFSI